MLGSTKLIKHFCDSETEHKDLIGRYCKIKPEVLKKYREDGCGEHAKLCSGRLKIIETQTNGYGKVLVRVQNKKIKNLHPDCGDFLNSFPKSLEEIIILEK